jgi:hypothetical protein
MHLMAELAGVNHHITLDQMRIAITVLHHKLVRNPINEIKSQHRKRRHLKLIQLRPLISSNHFRLESKASHPHLFSNLTSFSVLHHMFLMAALLEVLLKRAVHTLTSLPTTPRLPVLPYRSQYNKILPKQISAKVIFIIIN